MRDATRCDASRHDGGAPDTRRAAADIFLRLFSILIDFRFDDASFAIFISLISAITD
jgi:hypothetical protein